MQVDKTFQTHFPSKRDAWLSIVVWLGTIICLAGGVVQLASAASTFVRIAILIVLSISAGFMLWVLYGTHYIFSGEVLHIRSGPFTFQVPLAEVVSVERYRAPVSSPACSLDRLLICYGHKWILVSPYDQDGFLNTFVNRSPHLVRRGNRVIRLSDA